MEPISERGGVIFSVEIGCYQFLEVAHIAFGTGSSTTTEEKRIIKPEEFAYLQDVVCVFPAGYRRIEKAYYFEDKHFSSQV